MSYEQDDDNSRNNKFKLALKKFGPFLKKLKAGLSIITSLLIGIPFGLLGSVLYFILLLALFYLAYDFLNIYLDNNNPDRSGNLRATILVITAVLGALGIPFFFYRTWLAGKQTKTAEHQAETARDRAYTELFTKAIEQLGAEKPKKEDVLDENGKPVKDNSGQTMMKEIYVPNIEVRIGAIFALERIMKDSEKDAASVVDTLAAYVRENCGKPTLVCEIPEEEDFESTHEWVSAIKDYVGDVWLPGEGSLVARARALRDQPQVNRADIKTALTVIGRRPDWLKDPKKFKTQTPEMPDLRDVNFQGWDLTEFDLSWCNLSGANMQGADMSRAKMQGAKMLGAEMQGANMFKAQMQGADMSFAKLQGADIAYAKLQGANMVFAQMQGAEMSDTNLQGADMLNAQMQGAKMLSAQMQGAKMLSAQMQEANMSDAQMQGADMFNVEMQGAEMSDAKIEKVQITRARKTAASVLWVDFTKSKFEFDELQEQLPEMFGHKKETILPKGMAIPEHWSEADMETEEGHEQYKREWEAFKKQMGF